jgi:hypothetical protein
MTRSPLGFVLQPTLSMPAGYPSSCYHSLAASRSSSSSPFVQEVNWNFSCNPGPGQRARCCIVSKRARHYTVPSKSPVPILHSAVAHVCTGRKRVLAVPRVRRLPVGPGFHTAIFADRVVDRTPGVLFVAVSYTPADWVLWQDSSPIYQPSGSARHRAIVASRLIK